MKIYLNKVLGLFKIFLVILFLSCSSHNVNKPPLVKRGVIDLTGQARVVNLEGEWEFYWNQFVKPGQKLGEVNLGLSQVEQNKEKLTHNSFIKVPNSWNSYIPEASRETIGGTGYATYRILIQNRPENFTHLKLMYIATAYRVYANGVLLAEVGRVGDVEENSSPYTVAKIVKIPNQ